MEEKFNQLSNLKKEKEETYKKITENNENYSLIIRVKDNCSIYISIALKENNKIYEDIKSYEEIKKQQVYFEGYSLEEIYDELNELISNNSYEFNKINEQILFNVVLVSKKRKTLNFVLEIEKSENIIKNNLFQHIINQKDEVIKKQEYEMKLKNEIIKKQEEIIKRKDEDMIKLNDFLKKNDEIIKGQDNIFDQKEDMIKKQNEMIKIYVETLKQKDEIIKQKDNVIKILEEIVKKKNYIEEKKEDENQYFKKNMDYNLSFKDFNIINHASKNKLSNHGEKAIYTILQLQDGRLASGGNDGSVIIYNIKTFIPEIVIKEHSKSIYDIIQLKNGNLISCSYDDKKLNEYKINENNTYKILSSIDVGKDNRPYKILELENNEIGLVAYNNVIFFSNKNNNLNESFKIKCDNNKIGQCYEMIQVKPGELVISGNEKKIQFFELKTRKLKEIIKINRNICWSPCNLLCMMSENYLCVGGEEKITIIDVYNKNIINEIYESGVHRCIFKLNDTILLTGKDNGDLTQWEIKGNNLIFVNKKENAHKKGIRDIIRFSNTIISCSDDYSIKIW